MQVPRRKPLQAKIGIFGVGHETYWQQFPGLREELMGKLDVFVRRVQNEGVETVSFGMVDNALRAAECVTKIQRENLDLLFCNMVTYATSASIGRIFSQVDVPIVLVALQPKKAMDYANASTYMQLCNDDFCAVPEFMGVARRMGKRVEDVILGTLYDDPVADAEISRWCSIAKVLHDLRTARIGHLGHVLEAMLDMHTDPTALSRTFGVHVVQCEAEEIEKHYREEWTDEIAAKKREILAFFDTPDAVSDPVTTKLTETDLHIAAKAAVALERFIQEKQLDGLAYYYEGAPETSLREVMTNLIVGNSLLTAAGFPMCGEFDIKTCVAMLIFDRLGIGGSFAEFHPLDFERNTILVGHDGPHHLNIADGKPVLRSLRKYHGKPGKGASVEFKIKVGPITMLSLGVKEDGQFRFVLAEGESQEGPIPPTGNTNTHGYFGEDLRGFLKRWVLAAPTHHFALGVGHHAETIEKIAAVLGVECINVNKTAQRRKNI
ncbi:MAG: L-fucose/L-arabinose isomerase family protein, partial [Planctomycetia bacterium]|nr:L-fucose/L-arabinose isomerase family protein [Planctomycetia bacterium]